MKKTQEKDLHIYAEILIRSFYGIEPEDCDLQTHILSCRDRSEVEDVVEWIGDKYGLMREQ